MVVVVSLLLVDGEISVDEDCEPTETASSVSETAVAPLYRCALERGRVLVVGMGAADVEVELVASAAAMMTPETPTIPVDDPDQRVLGLRTRPLLRWSVERGGEGSMKGGENRNK